MSSGASLFVVAVAVFLLECIVRVPGDRTVFISGWRRSFRPAVPHALFGSGSGVVLTLPLPPLGRAVLAGADGPLPERIDADALAARLAAWGEATRSLVFLTNAAWGWVFLVCPALASLRGLAATWLPLLAGLLVLEAAISYEYVRAHRVLYPAERWTRLGHAIVLILSPPAAIRADDLVSRNLLARAHPLVAAILLGDPREIEADTRRALYDAGLLGDGGTPAPAWLEPLLAGRGLSLASIAAPPPPSSPDARAFCPRCHTQFAREAGPCEACAIPLAPFRGAR